MDPSNTSEASSQPYLGDLQKTQILQELFAIPRESRDDAWRISLLEAAAEASFACGDPQVIEGPDGFPYFQLFIPEPGKPFTCYVIKNMKDEFLLSQGFGVILLAHGGKSPNWVFSSGDIVNLHVNNEFYSDGDQWYSPEPEGTKQDEQVLTGQPSEQLLPTATRVLLRNFFKANEIPDGKILLMMRKRPTGVLQELVFNLTPTNCKSQGHFDSIMRTLSWYLPRHYSFSSMAEASMADSFEPI